MNQNIHTHVIVEGCNNLIFCQYFQSELMEVIEHKGIPEYFHSFVQLLIITCAL